MEFVLKVKGDWYVVAFYHLRKEIRTFSFARMLKAKLLPDAFQILATFDFHKLTGSHFGVHWSDVEFEVKIQFNKAIAGYLKERKWHPSQQIKDKPHGSVILLLTVNHLLELKRWILSWGVWQRCWSQRVLLKMSRRLLMK